MDNRISDEQVSMLADLLQGKGRQGRQQRHGRELGGDGETDPQAGVDVVPCPPPLR